MSMTAHRVQARGSVASTAEGVLMLHSGCAQCSARCAKPASFYLDHLPISGREGTEVEISAQAKALTLAAVICFGVPLMSFISLYFGALTRLSHWQALLVALCGAVVALTWAGHRGAMIERHLALRARYVTPEDVS